MSASQQSRTTPSRRTVVAAAGAAGLATALVACGGAEESGEGSGGTGASDASSGPLAKTSDIPEGGGKIFSDQQVVVTQPKKGEFKAFSTICTHQGCKVSSVSDGTINCPCHRSKFSIEDGSVQQPPATTPLPVREIKVSGDDITLV